MVNNTLLPRLNTTQQITNITRNQRGAHGASMVNDRNAFENLIQAVKICIPLSGFYWKNVALCVSTIRFISN